PSIIRSIPRKRKPFHFVVSSFSYPPGTPSPEQQMDRSTPIPCLSALSDTTILTRVVASNGGLKLAHGRDGLSHTLTIGELGSESQHFKVWGEATKDPWRRYLAIGPPAGGAFLNIPGVVPPNVLVLDPPITEPRSGPSGGAEVLP